MPKNQSQINGLAKRTKVFVIPAGFCIMPCVCVVQKKRVMSAPVVALIIGIPCTRERNGNLVTFPTNILFDYEKLVLSNKWLLVDCPLLVWNLHSS